MRRVFLKLSGEALAGAKGHGFDEAICRNVAEQVKEAVADNVQVGIIIGGGNFWRGRTGNEIDRTKSDQIGMLATVMNALYVSEIFRTCGMETEVFTPFVIGAMTKLFSKDEAKKAFGEGKVCFFAGGTGHPYFSTDTGVALFAIQMEAEMIYLAKAIDGVYDSDPKKNPEAKKFSTISLQEVLDRQLQVIDLTASQMCMDNHMPLCVFSLLEENSIRKALKGTVDGTIITV